MWCLTLLRALSRHVSSITQALLLAARDLRDRVDRLRFVPPVTHVYNPLGYAWTTYEAYLRKYATGRKRVLFLGMNPGPFGMVQTGVPFGDVASVRDWLQLGSIAIHQPWRNHPQRPVTGFACLRPEVSGQRLWGLFAARFGTPERFFSNHLVLNYCPLAFLERSGRNRTPDKLPKSESAPLFAACDGHLRAVAAAIQPHWLIGIGRFARERIEKVFPKPGSEVGQILHPSPASPAANRNWAALATRQLEEIGAWAPG